MKASGHHKESDQVHESSRLPSKKKPDTDEVQLKRAVSLMGLGDHF